MKYENNVRQTQLRRLERRNCFISKEFQKYNIDNAALSKVKFAEKFSIREETSYTSF